MSDYWNARRACRFCHCRDQPEMLVQYSTRHYAHFVCYLARKPISVLPRNQIVKFPYGLLQVRGLLAEVERLT